MGPSWSSLCCDERTSRKERSIILPKKLLVSGISANSSTVKWTNYRKKQEAVGRKTKGINKNISGDFAQPDLFVNMIAIPGCSALTPLKKEACSNVSDEFAYGAGGRGVQEVSGQSTGIQAKALLQGSQREPMLRPFNRGRKTRKEYEQTGRIKPLTILASQAIICWGKLYSLPWAVWDQKRAFRMSKRVMLTHPSDWLLNHLRQVSFALGKGLYMANHGSMQEFTPTLCRKCW